MEWVCITYYYLSNQPTYTYIEITCIIVVNSDKYMHSRKSTVPQKIKTLIHNILLHNLFYRLDARQYQLLLQLLEQTPAQDPQEIQNKIFEGIYLFTKNYGENLEEVLASKIHIPLDLRIPLFHILHEFMFLNSIGASKMFQDQLRQRNPNNIFNDQLEKAKIHYMYYGNSNPYRMQMIGGQRMHNSISSAQASQNHSINSRPIRPSPHSLSELEQLSRQDRPQRTFGNKRSLVASRLVQNTDAVISPVLKKIIFHEMGVQSVLGKPDYQLQECVCRGFVESEQKFYCACGRVLHDKCMEGIRQCLDCRMQKRDAFLKPLETILLKYVDCQNGFLSLQQQIDFKKYQNAIKASSSVQIVVSMAHPSQSGVCWPDGVIFKINGQAIFEVPAMMQFHKENRKDRAVNVTRYIMSSKAGRSPTKIGLQLSEKGLEYGKRSNRKGSFLFAVYLVQQLSVEDLRKQIITEGEKHSSVNPVQRMQKSDEISMQSLQVSILDPFTGNMIQTPVKGNRCTHATCFDLVTYLTVMKASVDRPWRCPVCGKHVNKLVLDSYHKQIIQGLKKTGKKAKAIRFKRGTIEIIQADEQYGDSLSEQQQKKNQQKKAMNNLGQVQYSD